MWRRPHNEKIHSLYRSPNIERVINSRILRRACHVTRIEEGTSAANRPFGKPRPRWEDNIRMHLKE